MVVRVSQRRFCAFSYFILLVKECTCYESSRKGKEEKSRRKIVITTLLSFSLITTWSLRIRPQALNLQYIQGCQSIGLVYSYYYSYLNKMYVQKRHYNIWQKTVLVMKAAGKGKEAKSGQKINEFFFSSCSLSLNRVTNLLELPPPLHSIMN